jgi:hypothetical protein
LLGFPYLAQVLHRPSVFLSKSIGECVLGMALVTRVAIIPLGIFSFVSGLAINVLQVFLCEFALI